MCPAPRWVLRVGRFSFAPLRAQSLHAASIHQVPLEGRDHPPQGAPAQGGFPEPCWERRPTRGHGRGCGRGLGVHGLYSTCSFGNGRPPPWPEIAGSGTNPTSRELRVCSVPHPTAGCTVLSPSSMFCRGRRRGPASPPCRWSPRSLPCWTLAVMWAPGTCRAVAVPAPGGVPRAPGAPEALQGFAERTQEHRLRKPRTPRPNPDFPLTSPGLMFLLCDVRIMVVA